MARARLLSKSLSTSSKRARLRSVLGVCRCGALTDFAQALYPLLIAHSDDWGREIADPFAVKNTIDPSSPHPLRDFAEALFGLQTVGLIQLYANGESIVLQIIDFEEHQRGLHKRTPSKLPPPLAELPGISRKFLLARAREQEQEQNENRTLKNAAAPLSFQTLPVQKSRRPKQPKVPTLAALFRTELLLKQPPSDEGELIEAAKHLAAQHHLDYTAATITRALASARGQLAKRGN